MIESQTTGWQPIESAPTDGTKILICGPNFDHPCVGLYERGWRGDHYGAREPYWHFSKVTHWMPLPEPPDED